MSAISTADLHLSSRPRDEYRWSLFDWLLEQDADELILAGDISDQKDRHDAVYVNRLFDAVMDLERKFRVIILAGNHDFFDPDHPFFAFLGSSSDILFLTKPAKIKLSIGEAYFVPAWVKWDFKIPEVDYIFTHATFSGAKAETGRTLTGVDPSVLADFDGKVYSGDIHAPQKLLRGKIEYVGAPYHVRFGDVFKPRVLKIADDGSTEDLHFPSPRKLTLNITKPDDLFEEDVVAGDHVKIRCLLRRAEYDKWRGYHELIREIATKRKWKLFSAEPVALEISAPAHAVDGSIQTPLGVDSEQLVTDYAKKHKASADYAQAGLDLLLASK